MRNILFAAVAVLGLFTAIPAFADGGGEGDRVGSASSVPSGFYDSTPQQVQAQIMQNYLAAQQAKPVANDASPKALRHIG